MEARSIEARVLAGEALRDELVVDVHCHMGPWAAFVVHEGGPAGMVRTMDRCGIDWACIAPHAAIGPDFGGGNDEAARARDEIPGRFIAYCTLNGRYPAEANAAELDRCLAMGFRGIKLHPAVHQTPLDGPNLRPAFETASARELPVLVHTWHNDALASPAMFEALCHDFPGIRFILGHTGGSPEGADQYLALAPKCEHVYFDLCGSLMNLGMIERIVDAAGDERVLFGSDLPFIDCRPMLGYIGFSRVSDESKRRILGLNAARLFGLGDR
ncbi:MAG TPA: amidohydrolase family protein [Armatimonadota bacterium]|nr:amidohydrolase family protein [Armatimonadota bacterium]